MCSAPSLDDTISLSSSTGGRTTARVVGIFQTGVTPVDYSRAYMLLNMPRRCWTRRTSSTRSSSAPTTTPRPRPYAPADRIDLRLPHRKLAGGQRQLPEDLQDPGRSSPTSSPASLLIVAAFGVLNILIMAVLERVNDIAILKSFGLSRARHHVIYLFQGLVIGLIGSTLGLIVRQAGDRRASADPDPVEGLIKAEGLLMSEHAQPVLHGVHRVDDHRAARGGLSRPSRGEVRSGGGDPWSALNHGTPPRRSGSIVGPDYLGDEEDPIRSASAGQAAIGHSAGSTSQETGSTALLLARRTSTASWARATPRTTSSKA